MNAMGKTLFRFVFITLTILTTSFCSVLWAQDCSPINLDLTTQVDVDNFQLNHGPCDRVGNLLVQGDDITNLDGLSGLANVGTFLSINNNPLLADITGLSTLTDVSGLDVKDNASLGNLNGLSAVTSLRSLGIYDNNGLTDLSGLSALINVDGEVIIADNLTLGNLDGLSAMLNVGGLLTVAGNASLTDLNGLSALTSVGAGDWVGNDGLSILQNESLANVDGLAAVTKLHGELWIQDNANLTDVDGLLGISSSDGLAIKNNTSLSNLDGLSTLTHAGDWLVIENNPMLENIDGLSGITSVGSWPGIRIVDNASLKNLNGLSALTWVGGDLTIIRNTSLSDLDGLSVFMGAGNDLDIRGNDSLTNVNGLSALNSVGGRLYVQLNQSLIDCDGLSWLLDQWDDAEPGPGPGFDGVPDVGNSIYIGDNLVGCNSIGEILATVNPSRINPGLNDAWFDPATDGQGFFITVFPDLGAVSLAWFTYDTELPPQDATANLGDPGHRWLTGVGPIEGNQVTMEIEMTSGGLFDTPTLIDRTDPPGSDGTIILIFTSCNSATIEYDIPSINRQGTVPIRRVADDNIVLCEALKTD